MLHFDISKSFEYENGFYLTSGVNRISKFATHFDLFRRTMGLPGDIVECGVFKGASLSRWIKFRALLENPFSRQIIGFDTFSHFPEATFDEDRAIRDKFVEEAGDESISVAEMYRVLSELGLQQNIDLVEGDLLATLPQYIDSNPQLRISLLHIDVDLYEPTKIVLELLFPRVVKGGIVILDDYGAFPGANKAIEEYFGDSSLTIKKLPFSNAISFVEKC